MNKTQNPCLFGRQAKRVKLKRFSSKFLILSLIIGVFSCQKDDVEITESNTNNLNIKEYTFNELNNNATFSKSYNKIVEAIKKKRLNEGRSLDTNDFVIDSTLIKEISIGNTTSYTFSAYLDNQEPNSFNNIVIQIDSLGNDRALLITYFPESPMEYIEDHNSYAFSGTSIAEEINIDSSFIGNRDMDMGCYVNWYCNWGGTTHPAGQNCTEGYMFSVTSCSSGGGGGGGSGGGGSGGGSPSTSPEPIFTSETVPIKQLVIECLQLDDVQNANLPVTNWINHPDNHFQVKAINLFLKQNNCSTEDQDFVIEAVEAILNGEVETFQEFLEINDDCNTSKNDLLVAFPNANPDDMELLADILNDHGTDFGINTAAELQHFLAQAGHESNGFANLGITENLNYSATRLTQVWPSRFSFTNPNLLNPNNYANNPEVLGNYVYCCRNGNGDIASGDGYLYRGRGIFQLTGRSNYEAYETFLNDNGLDWTYDGPESLETDLHAIISALWYFKSRVLDDIDVDDNTNANSVTNKVNFYTDKGSKNARQNQLNIMKNEIDCL